jgi:hypothetical protein
MVIGGDTTLIWRFPVFFLETVLQVFDIPALILKENGKQAVIYKT